MSVEQMARELGVPEKAIRRFVREMEQGRKAVEAQDRERLAGRVLLGLLLAFLLIAPLAHKDRIYDFANLPQNAFIQVGILFLLAVLCVRSAVGRGRLIVPCFTLPLAFFLAWSLCSMLWAHNRYEGFLSFAPWAAGFAVFLVAANALGDERDQKALLLVLFVSGLCTALLGMAQHLFPAAAGRWVPQVIPPAATFANKNMAVHHVVLTLPLAAGFFLVSGKAWQYTACAVAMALMGTYLIYTGTKGGWLAAGVEAMLLAGLLLWLRARGGADFGDRKKAAALAGALALFLVLVNVNAQGFSWDANHVFEEVSSAARSFSARLRTPEPPEATQKKAPRGGAAQVDASEPPETAPDVSVGLRLDIWRNTLEMILDHPVIGVGIGNHKLQYPLYIHRAVKEKVFSEEAQLTNVHNDFLQLMSETGVVGVAFLAWVIAAVCLAVVSLLRDRELSNRRFLVAAVFVGMTGMCVNSMVSFPFQRSIPPVVLGAYLAFAAVQRAPARLRLSKAVFWVLAAAFFAACLLAGRTYARWIAADDHYLTMISAEKAELWPRVIQEAEIAYRFNPHRKKIMSYMGRALIETGRPKEGIEAISKVLAAYPNHMNALLNLGVAYAASGQPEKALETYDKVLRIKPDYAKVHNNIGNVLVKQGKTREALKAFETAAGLDPKSPIVHFNVGVARMKLGDFPGAQDAFEKALAADAARPGTLPNGPSVLHYNLSVAYLNQGEYAKARTQMERALAYNPQWAEAHRTLGTILIKLGENQKAVRHFREAMRIKPSLFGVQPGAAPNNAPPGSRPPAPREPAAR